MQFGFAFTSAELVTLIVGSLVAFLVSLVVIKFLMGYIKKHDFKVFGWYRIALGAVVLLYFTLVKETPLAVFWDCRRGSLSSPWFSPKRQGAA